MLSYHIYLQNYPSLLILLHLNFSLPRRFTNFIRIYLLINSQWINHALKKSIYSKHPSNHSFLIPLLIPNQSWYKSTINIFHSMKPNCSYNRNNLNLNNIHLNNFLQPIQTPQIQIMKNLTKNNHPVTTILFNLLVDLPTPSNISYIWNWGSLLSLNLIIQLISGVLLSIHYTPHIDTAFSSTIHIIRDVNSGWLIRSIHINGASLFFILIYTHIRRGILFASFKTTSVWISGILILFAIIATAFLGYVLPWGQISFWGATVITNLVSAIPYLGSTIVTWLWGGFSVRNATLNRFFSLHFLLPFIVTALIGVHVASLHITGSNNPIGIKSNIDKIPFHPYFSSKDVLGVVTILSSFLTLSLIYPYRLGDPDNFNPANPLSTPIHIQPEWYFLFAYAILRSIPNKLGGVIALVISILVIAFLPLKTKNNLSSKFNPLKKIIFWVFRSSFLVLTWIGANPVEPPYELIGQLTSTIYFLLILYI